MSIEIGKQYVIKGHPYEPNNGLIVTVTGYFGKDVRFTYPSGNAGHWVGDRWSIDNHLVTFSTWRRERCEATHVNQDNLHPLDNNTGFEAGSWESLKDIFTPSKLVTNHKEALTNAN
jgi:hypothetical protein